MASLTSSSSWNRRLARKDLRCRNKWKSLGAKSGLYGGWSNCSQPNVVIRFCIVAAVCGRALSWIITTPQLSMPCSLFWIAWRSFFKCVAIDTCVDCGALRQEVHKQNAFSSELKFSAWISSLLAMKCASNPWTAASIQGLRVTPLSCPFVTTWLKKLLPSSLYYVRKSNALACRFNLCSSVSIFGTQRAHNFRNLSSSDAILWRSDHKIWGKCRESNVMVNRLFFLIFSSTARTKSSFTTDSRPLRRSSCTSLCPLLNSRTHLHTIELLMGCST